MKIPQPKTRPPAETMTPLINVVFLLLIFFMLTGTIAKPELLNISPPQARSGQEAQEGGLRIQLAADGRLAIGDRTLDKTDLDQAVTAHLRGKPDGRITIAADGAVTADRVLDLLDLLRKAGVERVSLITARKRK